MSHRGGRGDGRNARDPYPRRGPRHPDPIAGRVKRWKTKRERDTAKFGPKMPGGGWRGAGPPPRKLLPLWGIRPPGSPLPAPKTVIITQKRLCQHRGMFNREVKSVDVERLLSPPPAQGEPPCSETPIPQLEGDSHPAEQPPPPNPPEAPQSPKEKRVPCRPSLRDVATRLRSILGQIPAFPGRDLVGERRQTLLAALVQRHRVPPNLTFLLAHRNRGADAAPQGRWSPRTPESERGGSVERGRFGEHKQNWDTTPPYSSTPAPLQAIVEGTPTYPARLDTPSPLFREDGKEQETPFSWTSAEEDAECPDSPAALFRPQEARTPDWRGPHQHGGALPGSPLARIPPGCACAGAPFAPSCPASQPVLAVFGEAAGEGCSWDRRPPIAPPAFSPVAPQRCHPSRRFVSVLLAPRCPERRRGASADPEAPGTWSPVASRQAGCMSGWPRAKRVVPCCRHHHPARHDTLRHNLIEPSVFQNDPIQHNVLRNDPIRCDVLLNDPLQHDVLQHDPLQHNMIHNDPVHHSVLRNDPLRHDALWHDPIQSSAFQNDPLRHDVLWDDPIGHDQLQDDPLRRDVLQDDPIQRNMLRDDPLRHAVFRNDPIGHNRLRDDPLRHDVFRNDPIGHDQLRDDPLRHTVLRDDPIQRNTLRDDPLRHDVFRNDPIGHDQLRDDPLRHTVLRDDPLRHDVFRNDPMGHDQLRDDPLRHTVLWDDPLRHDVFRNDLIRHNQLRDDPLRHAVLRDDPIQRNMLRDDPLRHDVSWNDPLRHSRRRHSSHCFGQPLVPPSPGAWRCRQPPPLPEHRAHAESCQRREREEQWDVPELGGRGGLGEPGWMRVPQHQPLSCFSAPEVPGWDRSPPPIPESWGCPCAGPH